MGAMQEYSPSNKTTDKHYAWGQSMRDQLDGCALIEIVLMRNIPFCWNLNGMIGRAQTSLM